MTFRNLKFHFSPLFSRVLSSGKICFFPMCKSENHPFPKEYLSKSIQLHPTTFVFKKVNNFSLNKNYKVSYSNEASDKL